MNFKFSPKIIYPVVALVLVSILIIVAYNTNSIPAADKDARVKSESASKGIPQDESHKGIVPGVPSKANVSPEYQKQLNDLSESVKKNPSDTLKMREYADFLIQSHKIDEAATYYEKILKKYPKRTDLLFSMAYFNYMSRKLDKVEMYMNRVLAIEPNNLDAKYNIGAVYVDMQKPGEAKKIWQEIITKYPNSPLAKKAKESLAQIGN